MVIAWQATDLSVDPPSYQMADDDIETFGFDAEEPVTAATATLIRLDTLAAAGTVTAPDIADDVARVTVSGLTRGIVYELAVTFEAASGRKWTRTLVIPCVS